MRLVRLASVVVAVLVTANVDVAAAAESMREIVHIQ